MSFLNPTPVPVTLYQSTDPDAPQLGSNNWQGAIKTILKACLVSGYGGKQGAGWAMTDETEHKATFTPTDPQAPPVGIIMDSGNRQYSQFDLVWRGTPQGIAVQGITRISNQQVTANWTWALVASARGFAFLPTMRYGNHAPAAALLYFGALNHNLRNPQGQDFVCMPTAGNNWTTPSSLRTMLSNGSRSAWSVGDLKTGGNLGDGRNGALWTASALAAQRNSAQKWATDAVPMQSRLYSEIMVQNTTALVGKIPGLLVASHRLEGDRDGDIVQIEGSPHRWLWSEQLESLTNGGGIGLLVNLDEWEY